jgi:hypothetical protein
MTTTISESGLRWQSRDVVRASSILLGLLRPHEGGRTSGSHSSTLRRQVLTPFMPESGDVHPHSHARGHDSSPREAPRTGEPSSPAASPVPDTFGCMALRLALVRSGDPNVLGSSRSAGQERLHWASQSASRPSGSHQGRSRPSTDQISVWRNVVPCSGRP